MHDPRSYLQIKEAAAFLAVSPSTLRNWERRGKIITHRHPINGYRLYKESDLEAILREIERSGAVRHSTEPAAVADRSEQSEG